MNIRYGKACSFGISKCCFEMLQLVFKRTGIYGNCEWGLISKHYCPSCGQDVPSCFTFGSTLAALVKLGNIFLASLFVVLPKRLSRFQGSCHSKCWHWWNLVESNECRTEFGVLRVWRLMSCVVSVSLLWPFHMIMGKLSPSSCFWKIRMAI